MLVIFMLALALALVVALLFVLKYFYLVFVVVLVAAAEHTCIFMLISQTRLGSLVLIFETDNNTLIK